MSPINKTVETTLSDTGILHVKLNRPAHLNALNHEMLQCLFELFCEAQSQSSVKAILLSGTGKAFCAGADVKELMPLDGVSGLSFAEHGQKVFNQLEQLGKPVLSALHGFVFGGGCELAMATTLRLAAVNTTFAQPEVKLGLIPGFGGTQRLARLIGKGRALELCLTGKQFGAEQGLQWGLLNAVVALDDLLPCAYAWLNDILKFSPIVLKSILISMNEGYDLSLAEGLALEAAHFARCCTTKDKQEGVSAFLEKRTPDFMRDSNE